MSDIIVKNECTNPNASIIVNDLTPILPGKSSSTITGVTSFKVTINSSPTGLFYKIPFTLTNNEFIIPLPSDDALNSDPINVSIGDGQG
jgi:hypothetical protein